MNSKIEHVLQNIKSLKRGLFTEKKDQYCAVPHEKLNNTTLGYWVQNVYKVSLFHNVDLHRNKINKMALKSSKRTHFWSLYVYHTLFKYAYFLKYP